MSPFQTQLWLMLQSHQLSCKDSRVTWRILIKTVNLKWWWTQWPLICMMAVLGARIIVVAMNSVIRINMVEVGTVLILTKVGLLMTRRSSCSLDHFHRCRTMTSRSREFKRRRLMRCRWAAVRMTPRSPMSIVTTQQSHRCLQQISSTLRPSVR